MKLMHVVALSGFLLGLAFLTYSAASGEEVNIVGLTVHSRILRGLGVIAMIFSAITFLAAFGGMGAPPPQERPKG
jgi:hypothetical protein